MSWARYFTPAPALERLGLTCLGVGWQEGALRPCGPRTLDSYALVLVVRGDGWIDADGVRHPISAPAAVWLRPGMRHAYGPHQGWEEWWTLCDGSAAEIYLELGWIGRAGPVTTLDADIARRMVQIFVKMRRTLAEGPVDVDAILAAVLHELMLTGRESGVRRHPLVAHALPQSAAHRQTRMLPSVDITRPGSARSA
ncbi:AraC family ligand binding domain-containing protein [Actinomadura sp. ATCC 39365]|uniref:AraC family ligand binding domain-containing protein n=1 Tax=Nonomuraea sp. NPDC005692 TaxID=3157168 RepID=UPI0033F17867